MAIDKLKYMKTTVINNETYLIVKEYNEYAAMLMDKNGKYISVYYWNQ